MTTKAILELIKEKQGIRLDLGCGKVVQPGFVGIDKRALPGVDIVHDLEVYPWPLPDECATIILASHLVEHIDPAHGGFLRFMDECWRVAKPDAQLVIITPYAGSAAYWQDPTHINGCNEVTWAYFDPLHPHIKDALYNVYEPNPWKVASNKVTREGILEVIMQKRREDVSYHPDRREGPYANSLP